MSTNNPLYNKFLPIWHNNLQKRYSLTVGFSEDLFDKMAGNFVTFIVTKPSVLLLSQVTSVSNMIN